MTASAPKPNTRGRKASTPEAQTAAPIKVRTGDTVFYYPDPSESHPQAIAGNPLSGTITHVWSAGCVNIAGFDAVGQPYAKHAVALVGQGVPCPETRYAELDGGSLALLRDNMLACLAEIQDAELVETRDKLTKLFATLSLDRLPFVAIETIRVVRAAPPTVRERILVQLEEADAPRPSALQTPA